MRPQKNFPVVTLIPSAGTTKDETGVDVVLAERQTDDIKATIALTFTAVIKSLLPAGRPVFCRLSDRIQFISLQRVRHPIATILDIRAMQRYLEHHDAILSELYVMSPESPESKRMANVEGHNFKWQAATRARGRRQNPYPLHGQLPQSPSNSNGIKGRAATG